MKQHLGCFLRVVGFYWQYRAISCNIAMLIQHEPNTSITALFLREDLYCRSFEGICTGSILYLYVKSHFRDLTSLLARFFS